MTSFGAAVKSKTRTLPGVEIDNQVILDSDGILDAGERGLLKIKIGNGGPVRMSGTTLTVKTATPGFTFTGPTTVMVPDVDALASTTVAFEIAAASPLPSAGGFTVDIVAVNPGTCEGQATRTVVFRTNFDEIAMSSATEDVEASKLVWTTEGIPGDKIWSRTETAPLAYAIHGADWGSLSDTSLRSPDLKVSANMPFSINLEHRYSFEQGMDMGVLRNFDGAVIEITDDNGASWRDVIGYTNPGYGGTITTVSNNPLGNRNGFVKQNPSWPNRDKLTLNFGMNFAGKTVALRFRIGTDEAAGDTGWDIDNIQFVGVDNTPFTKLADNRTTCNPISLPDMAGTPGSLDLAVKPQPGTDGSTSNNTDGGKPEEPPLADHGCGCTLGGNAPVNGAGLAAFAFIAIVLGLGRRRRAR